MQAESAWRPTASLEALKLRATLLARIRAYFSRAGVLEVDTPALSPAGTTDPSIQSFHSTYHGPGPRCGSHLYLQTSPEFPMKRLLAAGSGAIYQICKVFRDGESGRSHNPEFTLLEWYRPGFDYFELMDDVEALLREILQGHMAPAAVNHWTYRELFLEIAGVDPFDEPVAGLEAILQSRGMAPPVGLAAHDRDGWLDVLLTHVIQPHLGPGLAFIRDYPASQAALARLRPGAPPVAARFEVFLDGIELANGYHELRAPAEQRRRFARDNERRLEQGLEPVVVDENLLAAMESGLPDCAGVALGFDRLLMVASGARSLDEVIAFPLSHA